MPQAGDSLEVWAAALSEAADRQRTGEADLRHDIFLVLGPYLRDEVGLPPQALQHEHTSLAGRYDSLFGRALIEYKRPGLLDTEMERRRAATQALEYLDDAQIGADVVIITDGRTWAILRDPAEGPVLGDQLALELGLEVQLLPIDRFQWRSNSPDTALRVLSLLASVTSTPITSRTITATLGLARVESNEVIRELARVLASRTPGSRADLLFAQWLQLAGVAYGIASGSEPWPRQGRTRVLGEQLAASLPSTSFAESVFVLHTFVALACKIIGAEVLALLSDRLDRRPSQWVSLDQSTFALALARLEDGELAEALGAPGLFAGDLFGWYAPVAASDRELHAALRSFFVAFSELAWAQLANARGKAGDLLRDFYTATVPRTLRRALGEFFTPQWLAERVFGQAVRLCQLEGKPIDRILDPACGSGTFVVIAFNYLIQRALSEGLRDDERVRRAIDGITGFDINPISTHDPCQPPSQPRVRGRASARDQLPCIPSRLDPAPGTTGWRDAARPAG